MMLEELLVRTYLEPQNTAYRQQLLESAIANPSELQALSQLFLRDAEPARTTFLYEFYGDCLETLSAAQDSTHCSQIVWFLSVQSGFIGEVISLCKEHHWLLAAPLFDLLIKFVELGSSFLPISHEFTHRIIAFLLELFASNIHRRRCLNVLSVLYWFYWNEQDYMGMLQVVFSSFPLLDYKVELQKLQLVGDNEAQVFLEIMDSLGRLLLRGAQKLLDCTIVLSYTLRVCSLEMMYPCFVAILTQSLGKLPYSIQTTSLMSAAVEVLISQVPDDCFDAEVEAAICRVFEIYPDLYLAVAEERLKLLFTVTHPQTREKGCQSLVQAVCFVCSRLKSEHDSWFFRWVHLLQNLCQIGEAAHRKEAIERILGLLGCNLQALKRHPISLKVLNGLLQRHPVIGWKTILKLDRADLLSRRTVEAVQTSIRRFEEREVRKALWQVVVRRLKLLRYDELFDYDIVNFIGVKHFHDWQVDVSRLFGLHPESREMFEGSEQFVAVVEHAKSAFFSL